MTETTTPTCIHCGTGFTTQEGLAGEVLVTEDGMMHEHCGEEADVAENQRRREHGDVTLIEWKTTAELPPGRAGEQANHYAWILVANEHPVVIFGRTTAEQALVFARLAVETAPERGIHESIVEQAKEHFRGYWQRRLHGLGLADDLPLDPFADA